MHHTIQLLRETIEARAKELELNPLMLACAIYILHRNEHLDRKSHRMTLDAKIFNYYLFNLLPIMYEMAVENRDSKNPILAMRGRLALVPLTKEAIEDYPKLMEYRSNFLKTTGCYQLLHVHRSALLRCMRDLLDLKNKAGAITATEATLQLCEKELQNYSDILLMHALGSKPEDLTNIMES